MRKFGDSESMLRPDAILRRPKADRSILGSILDHFLAAKQDPFNRTFSGMPCFA